MRPLRPCSKRAFRLRSPSVVLSSCGGGERKLEEIRRAFVADGRHIFIHGDRGVGKTSLAQTAAFEHQSADQTPILLTCDPSSSFYRIAQDLAGALANPDPTATKQTSTKKVNAGFLPFLSGEAQQAIEHGKIPDMHSINEAVAVVSFAAQRHSRAPVAVIDEFERMGADEERMLFADFIQADR